MQASMAVSACRRLAIWCGPHLIAGAGHDVANMAIVGRASYPASMCV